MSDVLLAPDVVRLHDATRDLVASVAIPAERELGTNEPTAELRSRLQRPGRRATSVHVGEPIVVERAKPTVASARELTARIERLADGPTTRFLPVAAQ